MDFIKKTILTLIVSCPVLTFAQANVRGKISDHRQNLPSATVLLLSADSTFVQGVVTDGVGEFVFENVSAGDYIISASMVGYAKFYSSRLKVKQENVTVSDIILEEEVT